MVDKFGQDAGAHVKPKGAQRRALSGDQLRLALKNLRPYPLLMPVFALVICAMSIFLTLREGGILNDELSVLSLLYVVYMFFMSREIHETARNMLLLRHEKNELIDEKNRLTDALANARIESNVALENAAAASRTKSEFLANMSHELRTPLNAILGFSEMLHSGDFDAKNAEYTKLIFDSGHHLLNLIDDILDLAKIEAGKFALHEEIVDLRDLIARSVMLMSGKANADGIALTADLPRELPSVLADARSLKQILLNLLSNAMKFTRRGGCIQIFARRGEDGDIVFGVRDTGVGIADADQGRVFENFGRGRHDIAVDAKGTGLGLPIVKGLTLLHGGHVALQSRVGEGTCVTVVFPHRRVCASEVRQAAS